jgi:hypothetical protein
MGDDARGPSEPRYVAVKLHKRGVNPYGFVVAGIEDRARGELINVANASMAIRLARWLNDEAEGRPLPERGPQHVPIRYQLAHDSLPRPATSVVYVHGASAIYVASAPRDEVARDLQRLLLHVDYPVDGTGLFEMTRAHDFGDRRSALPEQTLDLPKRDLRPYWKRSLGIALWMFFPMIVLATSVGFAFGWFLVGAFTVAWIAVMLLLGLAIRQ